MRSLRQVTIRGGLKWASLIFSSFIWILLKKSELCTNALAEEKEELRREKAKLLARFDYTEDKKMNHIVIADKSVVQELRKDV